MKVAGVALNEVKKKNVVSWGSYFELHGTDPPSISEVKELPIASLLQKTLPRRLVQVRGQLKYLADLRVGWLSAALPVFFLPPMDQVRSCHAGVGP